LEVNIEFTPTVINDLLTIWVPTDPGLVHQGAIIADNLLK
jgi:hypothetical protein